MATGIRTLAAALDAGATTRRGVRREPQPRVGVDWLREARAAVGKRAKAIRDRVAKAREAEAAERARLVERQHAVVARYRGAGGPGHPEARGELKAARREFNEKVRALLAELVDDVAEDAEELFATRAAAIDRVHAAHYVPHALLRASRRGPNGAELSEADAATRKAGLAVPPPAGPVVAGVDVGLEGDRSLYVARRGPRIVRIEAWNARRGREVADRALALADADGAVRLAVDAIGLGRGVAELLETEAHARRQEARRDEPEDPYDAALRREILRAQGGDGTRQVDGFALDMVNVGTRASDAVWPDGARACERFANLRAELWWTLRDGLAYAAEVAAAVEAGDATEADEIDWGRLLFLPDDDDLARDLGALSYGERNGRIVIEGKRDLRRRGGQSPDRADALALTFAPRTTVRIAVTEMAIC